LGDANQGFHRFTNSRGREVQLHYYTQLFYGKLDWQTCFDAFRFVTDTCRGANPDSVGGDWYMSSRDNTLKMLARINPYKDIV